jgi:putative lipoic acid-binding regulatory protein
MTPLSQQDAEWWDNFRALLDSQTEFPTEYTFKFIVPLEHMPELQSRLAGYDLQTRASRNGNYISATLTPTVQSSADVLALYERVSSVQGLIAL